MKRKRTLTFVFAIFTTSIIFVGFESVLSINKPLSEADNSSKEVCLPSSDIEGLQFCSSTTKVIANLGEEILLNFSIVNTSEKGIVVSGRGESTYVFVVTNGRGETLLTKREQTLNSRTLPDKELQREVIASSWISRRPDAIEIASRGRLDEKIKLTDIYDLSSAGRYYIETTRKTQEPSGGIIKLRAERLEIEIK